MKRKKRGCRPAILILNLILILILMLPGIAPGGPVPRENAVVRVVREVGPAVVNISSEVEVHVRAFPGFGGNPFFDSFFRDFFEPRMERKYQRDSLGSGVIIDGTRGLILTNAHVVAPAGRIAVTLQDEREFSVEIVGTDPPTDLAVLRIEADGNLPEVRMGTAEDLMIGETVIAIGNPFGFSHTVTTGVVSAVDRSIRTEDQTYHNFIQTDASINPGNSGGPLLNVRGEMIGINTAIYAKAQGIGFAIPIDQARRIVADLIAYGAVIPAWLGVDVQDVDRRMARYLDLPEGGGVLVRSVDPDSPAEAAGIRNGDIIRTLDGRPVASVRDFRMVLRGIPAGEPLALTIRRKKDDRLEIQVTTAEFPPERSAELAYSLFGLRVRKAGPGGLTISEVRPGSPISDVGVRPGDRLLKIGETDMADVADFYRAAIGHRHRAAAALVVARGGRRYSITIPL